MARLDPKYSLLTEHFRGGRKRVYKKGEVILHAGDDPQGVYYIERGLIKIYSLTKDGDEHIHLFYADGDIFPFVWIYRDTLRNVYYEAIEDTTVWLVPKETFKAFVASNIDIALLLLDKVTGLIRVYAGRVDTLQYSNSYERTATLLLSLAYRFGKSVEIGCLIDVSLTHQDIASSINLSRETVSRATERLQRKGIISYDRNRRIIITDLDKLIAIPGEDEVNGLWPGLVEQIHETY